MSSVLPTPVGPEKMKLAIGLFGFLRPTRALLIALDTALTLHLDQSVFYEEYLPYLII